MQTCTVPGYVSARIRWLVQDKRALSCRQGRCAPVTSAAHVQGAYDLCSVWRSGAGALAMAARFTR
jgi:hypothetical protein